MADTEEDFAKCGVSLEEQEHGEEEALTCDEVVDPTGAQYAPAIEKVQESKRTVSDSRSSGSKEAEAQGPDLEEKRRSQEQMEALKDSEPEEKKKGTHKD